METSDLIVVDLFCKESQIEINFIHDLEAFGLIEITAQNENKYLNKNQLGTLEKIIRLHNDLKINKEGIDIILNLQDKENQLLTEINYLKNRLSLYE
ncbi:MULTISPECIES: chaperone modulator CbpM [unclassified Flavobacterium]|uniref:chaperone modulator CbpM n=1 Tax=unclassified Flavobacterium TaxID=196869 RepID=UPI0002D6D7CE|nr:MULTISPECIES: chaperone modulator CbpM [unclassified Flavobacterium]MQP52267.1 MerR family transcriptional regulator [Flavobacterium sp. LMO9]MQP62337.1 MerR family transcriptional regulator [Flavobacterium sp. LMO6]